MRTSTGEETLAFQMKCLNIEFQREYRFHPTRRWRADFYLPSVNALLEVEGGVFVNGGHTRGKHFESDCEKYNTATALGFKVFRFTTDMVKRGEAIALLQSLKREQ